jgi:hypothetical protein
LDDLKKTQETFINSLQAANMGIAGKRGMTLKHQQVASLCLSPGMTNNYLALVVIFNKKFSIISWSGQDNIKYPTCSNTRSSLAAIFLNISIIKVK